MQPQPPHTLRVQGAEHGEGRLRPGQLKHPRALCEPLPRALASERSLYPAGSLALLLSASPQRLPPRLPAVHRLDPRRRGHLRRLPRGQLLLARGQLLLARSGLGPRPTAAEVGLEGRGGCRLRGGLRGGLLLFRQHRLPRRLSSVGRLELRDRPVLRPQVLAPRQALGLQLAGEQRLVYGPQFGVLAIAVAVLTVLVVDPRGELFGRHSRGIPIVCLAEHSILGVPFIFRTFEIHEQRELVKLG
mmetsp:Transcript_107212/g.303783  ORF Transcript_107212/g.303783 Transcript_107212/m.303783 type:complete len:245 (-) Transcript_107212:70-804(-)